MRDIKLSLDQGNLVLIDTQLFGGHTFVINGYDDAAHNLMVMDPNIAAPGIRVVSYRDIEVIWNSRGAGFNNRGAIFTGAKK